MVAGTFIEYIYIYKKEYTEGGGVLTLRRWRRAACGRNQKAGGKGPLIYCKVCRVKIL